MFLPGNKAYCLSSVNPSTKTIHHYHHYIRKIPDFDISVQEVVFSFLKFLFCRVGFNLPYLLSIYENRKSPTSQNCVSQQLLSFEIISNKFWTIAILIMHITLRKMP